jgi:hypothetical protein
MKIIIGRKAVDEQYFPFEGMLPQEIRDTITSYQNSELNVTIVTLNRTVLDMVTSADSKGCIIPYEDVIIRKMSGVEVPLLDIVDEAWLSHFMLGDVFDRMSHNWGL